MFEQSSKDGKHVGLEIIEKFGFGHLQLLASLDLSQNLLDRIEIHYFQGLIRMTQLNACNNRIKSIEIDSFVQNNFLESLDLSTNHLTKIQNGLFNEAFQLKHLYSFIII